MSKSGEYNVTTSLDRPSAPAHEEEHHPIGLEFVRFVPLERGIHATMVVSFLCLALTGMTLKFSYTPWARVISRMLGGFETAGYIHRSAAVVMFSVFVTHLVSLRNLKNRKYGSWSAMILGPNSMVPWIEGRQGIRCDHEVVSRERSASAVRALDLLGEVRLLRGVLGYFHHRLHRPYAVVPDLVYPVLPGWFINLATIIHSDEALLATGFIFTVHFFNTHLRPEKFPMDVVVFTGQMPLAELKRDKPMEYEDLVHSGELKSHMAEPHPAVVVKMIRAFAFLALSIGFSLVIGIIYAMIFAYR